MLPLPSKRASVAPALVQDEDESSSEDDEANPEDGSTGNLVVETRNLALGLSDTSSTGSLASGPTRPPPPLPSPGESPISKPLPPSPKHAAQSSTANPGPPREPERPAREAGQPSQPQVELRRREDKTRKEKNESRDSLVETRQNRDSQNSAVSAGRTNRSSLIETPAKPTTDLLQNIEPYDVLFLSNDTPKPKSPGLISSTPDVALSSTPGQPTPPPLPPPSKNYRHSAHVGSVRISTNKYSHPSICDTQSETGTASRWKVSAKIQQLLNTLKKPKRRPLPEFYEDDDLELEMAANNKDPNAPRPEGSCMSPAVGSQLVIPAGLPRNLEAAIQRYGSATYKAPMATVLDPNGKLSITLSYGKLLSRSLKIAYSLLNKIGLNNKDGMSQVKPGDRVALVYPNNDPLNMICAFYGLAICPLLMAIGVNSPKPDYPITNHIGGQYIMYLFIV